MMKQHTLMITLYQNMSLIKLEFNKPTWMNSHILLIDLCKIINQIFKYMDKCQIQEILIFGYFWDLGLLFIICTWYI